MDSVEELRLRITKLDTEIELQRSKLLPVANLEHDKISQPQLNATPAPPARNFLRNIGPTSIVIANRLTEDPRTSVLLLEALPRLARNIGIIASIIPMFPAQLNPDTPFDWNYTTTPQPGFNGRSINYRSLFLLSHTSEWDRYARLGGDRGWSWNNVQKYIRMNEKWIPPVDHHIRQGNLILSSTAPLESILSVYQGWLQSTINGGQRSSAATSYLGPSFMSKPNLYVLLNSRVTRLIQTGVDKGKPAFRAVEFTGNETGPRTIVAAKKEVILSAGSIGTPQILLLSGIGDHRDLSALGIKTIVDNPSVGRNLTDHSLLASAWYVNSTGTFDSLTRNATLAAAEVEQWEQTQMGLLVDSPLAHLIWSRVPDHSFSIQDPSAGPNTPHYELLLANGWVRLAPIPETGNFMSILTLKTANPFDQPNINPNLLGSDFDLFVMTEAVRAARNFLNSKAWKGYIIREFEDLAAATTDAKLKEYIQNNSGTVFHPVGTASMSPKGGISGLRIADASILPIVPSAHTQVPVYIVGERAADLVKIAYRLN
ncbi:aryl-alcohol oxidase [Mycena olivaceomarginata]|nr:aryl-alcohol oxidase [Mycena olivaceomarginata]